MFKKHDKNGQDKHVTEFIVHFHTYDGNYNGWDLWVWLPGCEGSTYAFTGRDDFGVVARITFTSPVKTLGFIIKRNGWSEKDVPMDRFVDIKNGRAEVWIVQGDATIYLAKSEADTRPKVLTAVFREQGIDLVLTATCHASGAILNVDQFQVFDEFGRELTITSRMIIDEKQIRLVIAEMLNVKHMYRVSHPVYVGKNVDVSAAINDPAYFYDGDDLGYTYTPVATAFRVWTPVATDVFLLLFNDPNGPCRAKLPMLPDRNGTWRLEVQGDLAGKYYLYEVKVFGEWRQTPDPYSKGLSANSRRSLILDMEATNPPGWEEHFRPEFNRYTDAVIYETHLRDLTIHPQSGIKHKGKYLALTETDTRGPHGVKTGLAHLKELGVTHVHFLPLADYANVDETQNTGYNWGYDPEFYNVPEGSYATEPNDGSRVRELKQLIMALHQNGLRVVMDVVYNHTAHVGTSAFDLLVPKFFYRMDPNGNYASASGCGNEVATERLMVRKFILDSLKFWVREYKVDGFRFDLMGIYDLETIKAIVKEIHALNPSLLLYGEPWAAGLVRLPADKLFYKGWQRHMGLALFNDGFRNALKGDTSGHWPGYVQGRAEEREAVIKGIMGSIDDFAATPGETINYVSCHDDLCLWDKLMKSAPEATEEERIRMSQLANGIVLVSQGIPFLHGGEEFARTKQGIRDSVRSGDAVNQYDYARKHKYEKLFRFYQGMIHLRRQHPAFRMNDPEEIRRNLRFFSTPQQTIGFLLENGANGDSWKTILVLINPNRFAVGVELPLPGPWTVVVNEHEAGVTPVTSGVSLVTGNWLEVPPIAMMVMHK
ncbi:MAG TPA: type I pullulanase [Bacillota bacterium]|nr:type I pullulanase [Bacillota bacterium]